jgi:hypothetical protein
MTPEPAREFDVVSGGRGDDAEGSILEDLRAELSGKLEEDEEIVLEVSGRPGWAVRFSTVIDHTRLQAWRRSCFAKRGGAADVTAFDDLKLASQVIGNQARALVRNGDDVEHNGEPLLFGHAEFRDLVGATDATDAVRRFYGRDSHVISTGTKVLEAAGYADAAEEAPDPTKQ